MWTPEDQRMGRGPAYMTPFGTRWHVITTCPALANIRVNDRAVGATSAPISSVMTDRSMPEVLGLLSTMTQVAHERKSNPTIIITSAKFAANTMIERLELGRKDDAERTCGGV